MDVAHRANWENLFASAGPDGMMLLAFKNPALKPLTGERGGLALDALALFGSLTVRRRVFAAPAKAEKARRTG